MELVLRRLEAEQYDGTNGAYLCGTFSRVTRDSDNGIVLRFTDGANNTYDMKVGDWLIRDRDAANATVPYAISNADFQQGYRTVTHPAVKNVALANGYALTPSINGSGGTASVAVDLDVTMSGITYKAKAVLSGTAALLSDLVITGVSVTDANTVTVTVQNNGALALSGATVIVTAVELTS